MENLYSNLHKKYSLQKTLRFELRPIGKTKENIEKDGILTEDEYKAFTAKKVKKYCDEYHKFFIDKCMSSFNLSYDLLNQYYILATKNSLTDEEKEQITNIQDSLRKEISDRFKNDDEFKGLFGKEIIDVYLKKYYKDDPEVLKELSKFKGFTTYFTGFNQNRENMYVETADSTAIAYRLINENLPIFVNNIKIYNLVKDVLKDKIEILFNEMNEYIQTYTMDDIFKLEYFNETLTQKGIEVYNCIIAGKSKENGEKIKGINEYINEYNQKNSNNKLTKFHQLYKQILSDKNGISFSIDLFENDQELVDNIQEFYLNSKDVLEFKFENLLNNLDKYDLNKIYLKNDLTLTQISKDIFDDWNKINQLLYKYYDSNYSGKNKIGSSNYEKERKNYLKNKKHYSISFLEKILNENDKSLVEYLRKYISNNSFSDNIKKYYMQVEEILNKKYESNCKELISDEKSIEKIKIFLDEIKNFQNYVKIFRLKDEINNIDIDFYNSFDELYLKIIDIIPLYNKTRNYLTQKPYSNEKIKLNFETPTLLDGWDANKEKANLGVLFKKDDNYYLGIIRKNCKLVFDESDEIDYVDGCYQKMVYKLLPGPNKMLPKVFFSKSRIDEFNPSEDLLEKYNKKLHLKGENFNIDFCHELIDFYKASINKHEDWKNFEFKFKDTNEYNDISEFYKDVEKQGYKVTFNNYSEEYINCLVENGELYLFQIYNKDFSKYRKGKLNLHTMYWKAVFDETNLENIVYKLNGEAEVFYRKASLKLEKTTIHPKNEPIKNKNINSPKKESVFDYDLIKNRRYTVDKFQFHVPITLNFINEEKKNINEEVNKYLKYNDVNVIGIDRGERNLLYITVVDPNGKILDKQQFSLNEITNEYKDNIYKVDYHKLLDNKEKDREKARESWKTIENIKELKEGYMSQVIHIIANLLEKYKAIIVIEDLNKGFKNSRIKIEKQVYQKFEKMLIDKLNYLVFKDKKANEEGGILNAYQLTNKFEGFNKIGRQTGILFYIPAWCTSKIDPTTGFINLINFKYESVEKSKQLIEKFDDINFNENDNYFEFKTDYLKFTNKSYGIRNKWTICTNGTRIETYRNPEINNNFDTKEINLTEEFKKLFNDYNIKLDNLKENILLQDSKDFYIRLLNLLKLTFQMRNSIPNTEIDYLISPVKNSKEYFYDSRTADYSLPKDADANGAYNIARKGLMFINQIKKTDDDKLGKIKFKISNEDWLTYVQEKDI